MSKRSKKLEEIKNMFKDLNINFDEINDNALSEIIKIIKLTEDERYQPSTKHLMSDIIMITFFAIISKTTEWKEIESFARKEEKDIYSIDGKTTSSLFRSVLTTTKINPLNTMSVYSHNYGVSII